jgi:hypothetical protein
MSPRSLLLSALLLSAWVHVGCSGSSASVPDPTQPIDPTEPTCAADASGRLPAPKCDASSDVQLARDEACPAGATCYSRALCGATILCASYLAQCAAVPVCDRNDQEVAACPSDAACYTRAMCGATILCAKQDQACRAIPTCDPGDKPVPGPSDCLLDNAACYSRAACGDTIWCTGPRNG